MTFQLDYLPNALHQHNDHQGFGALGHDSDCSSERRVVLTSNGWRAQCCQEERERVSEDMAAPECEREARKRRERRDSGCAHERKERRPHSEERTPPPPPPPPLQDYNRLEVAITRNTMSQRLNLNHLNFRNLRIFFQISE